MCTQVLSSNFALRCLQLEKISPLWLSVAVLVLGENIMWYFSLMQSCTCPVLSGSDFSKRLLCLHIFEGKKMMVTPTDNRANIEQSAFSKDNRKRQIFAIYFSILKKIVFSNTYEIFLTYI